MVDPRSKGMFEEDASTARATTAKSWRLCGLFITRVRFRYPDAFAFARERCASSNLATPAFNSALSFSTF